MLILQKSLTLVGLWLLSWMFLGAGLDLYKKGDYKPSAICFVTAFLTLLYMTKTVLFV